MDLIKAKLSAKLMLGGTQKHNAMLVSEENWSNLPENLYLVSISDY